MYSTFNNDMLAHMVKTNPELESVINTIITDNRKATSMFVHELRNPLSLMKGTVQYIEMKHPEAKEYKYWDQIQDLVNDMEHIMADASLLNTYNGINKEETNLILLIQNLTNSFMPQAFTMEIQLSFTVDPDGEAFFTAYPCDAVKIKQVLTNLIKNAFEATVPGNYIHVDLRHLPAEATSPAKLSIEISNNGAAIPPEVMENMFAPFVTYKKGGTGVGLALVRKVVDLHYGSVSVESNEERTSFIIRLPL
jgi:signal transduction histidine kinase